MGKGESNTSKSGLEVVGRGVAVVLAAREVARLRPVARVVVLLAVEPALELVELLTIVAACNTLGMQALLLVGKMPRAVGH